jgi:hypothetical protein
LRGRHQDIQSGLCAPLPSGLLDEIEYLVHAYIMLSGVLT